MRFTSRLEPTGGEDFINVPEWAEFRVGLSRLVGLCLLMRLGVGLGGAREIEISGISNLNVNIFEGN